MSYSFYNSKELVTIKFNRTKIVLHCSYPPFSADNFPETSFFFFFFFILFLFQLHFVSSICKPAGKLQKKREEYISELVN
jgi:hypothetical protein